jgi:Leucine-rich repeat (LRR) protein
LIWNQSIIFFRITGESWKGKNFTQQNLTQINSTINGELDISNNNIRSIDADQFELLEDLERLILNENKNFNFKANVMFLNKTELLTFNCVKCGITEIYNETFQGNIKVIFPEWVC